jgi:hypothetical protein
MFAAVSSTLLVVVLRRNYIPLTGSARVGARVHTRVSTRFGHPRFGTLRLIVLSTGLVLPGSRRFCRRVDRLTIVRMIVLGSARVARSNTKPSRSYFTVLESCAVALVLDIAV